VYFSLPLLRILSGHLRFDEQYLRHLRGRYRKAPPGIPCWVIGESTSRDNPCAPPPSLPHVLWKSDLFGAVLECSRAKCRLLPRRTNRDVELSRQDRPRSSGSATWLSGEKAESLLVVSFAVWYIFCGRRLSPHWLVSVPHFSLFFVFLTYPTKGR
jgi:hypothetical protein